jgi:hypothetical protein
MFNKEMKMIETNPLFKISQTRFAGLGYTCIWRGQWMFIDLDGNAPIGPKYPTKAELLADLRQFASERGFTLA